MMVKYMVHHCQMPCSAGKHENVCYCDPACRKRRLNRPSRSRVCAFALGDSALGCWRTVVQRFLQHNRSHYLTQGFFLGKDISAIIIHRTAYDLGQVTYMYTL